MEKRIALYPGTFDPPTLGHLDVMRKAAKIFDEVVVGILVNLGKSPMFSKEERLRMLKVMIVEQELVNVRAVLFDDGLTVEAAIQSEAVAIIRGLRLTTEYEKELEMSFSNDALSVRRIITVLLPPDQRYIHIHSSIVRDLIRLRRSSQGLEGVLMDYLTPKIAEIIVLELRRR